MIRSRMRWAFLNVTTRDETKTYSRTYNRYVRYLVEWSTSLFPSSSFHHATSTNSTKSHAPNPKSLPFCFPSPVSFSPGHASPRT